MLKAESLLQTAKGIMRSTRFCFLITKNAAGQVNARLMQPFKPEEDLTIYFATSPRSRKVYEIRGENQVTVAYEANTAYVALVGSARSRSDLNLRRKYWREEWASFFPAGPEGNDYIIIQFTPYRIELMSFDENVAPPPYGLKPAVLIRDGDSWAVALDSA